MKSLREKGQEAAGFLKSAYPRPIQAAVVLGLGLGAFAEGLDEKADRNGPARAG